MRALQEKNLKTCVSKVHTQSLNFTCIHIFNIMIYHLHLVKCIFSLL